MSVLFEEENIRKLESVPATSQLIINAKNPYFVKLKYLCCPYCKQRFRSRDAIVYKKKALKKIEKIKENATPYYDKDNNCVIPENYLLNVYSNAEDDIEIFSKNFTKKNNLRSTDFLLNDFNLKKFFPKLECPCCKENLNKNPFMKIYKYNTHPSYHTFINNGFDIRKKEDKIIIDCFYSRYISSNSLKINIETFIETIVINPISGQAYCFDKRKINTKRKSNAIYNITFSHYNISRFAEIPKEALEKIIELWLPYVSEKLHSSIKPEKIDTIYKVIYANNLYDIPLQTIEYLSTLTTQMPYASKKIIKIKNKYRKNPDFIYKFFKKNQISNTKQNYKLFFNNYESIDIYNKLKKFGFSHNFSYQIIKNKLKYVYYDNTRLCFINNKSNLNFLSKIVSAGYEEILISLFLNSDSFDNNLYKKISHYIEQSEVPKEIVNFKTNQELLDFYFLLYKKELCPKFYFQYSKEQLLFNKTFEDYKFSLIDTSEHFIDIIESRSAYSYYSPPSFSKKNLLKFIDNEQFMIVIHFQKKVIGYMLLKSEEQNKKPILMHSEFFINMPTETETKILNIWLENQNTLSENETNPKANLKETENRSCSPFLYSDVSHNPFVNETLLEFEIEYSDFKKPMLETRELIKSEFSEETDISDWIENEYLPF